MSSDPMSSIVLSYEYLNRELNHSLWFSPSLQMELAKKISGSGEEH